MKALILNSGLGHRMGVLTSEHPKCMTEISPTETILSRQLHLIADAGISEVIMTTGYFDNVLVNYCHSLCLPLQYTFVNNPLYAETNYIWYHPVNGQYVPETHVLYFQFFVVDDIGQVVHTDYFRCGYGGNIVMEGEN